MNTKLISICIPCYNNVDSLRRLLDSIQVQSFRDFEVIITDDSPNSSVFELVNEYAGSVDIQYHKNPESLGSPENWNRAIALSTGTWIKIMHHDDWFTHEHSLERFAAATNAGHKFIFCDYINIFEEDNRKEEIKFPVKKMKLMQQYPEILIAKNIIGNPSGTLIHHSLKTVQYDKRFIWRVDLEYYMQLIKQNITCFHISEPLITVGMISTQITRSVKLNPAVEIPEAHLLLEKYGIGMLNNIVVYDAYWRLFRNMHILSLAELQQYSKASWGKKIEHMLNGLSRCNANRLKKGWYSKMNMFLSFLSRPLKN